MKGLPTTWDVKTKKNVKWVAELGSQAYGNPVVANGVVLVGHQQRRADGSERQGGQGRPDGLPRVGRPVPVAGGARQARGRSRQRLAVSGRLLVAARRERHGYYVSNRGELMAVDIDGFRDGTNDGLVKDEKAHARNRRRHHLALRHDGGARRPSAQHGELVAGQLREPDLREHVERSGRKPRQHPVAEGAGDHRGRQEHRQAGVGRQLGRRDDPARTVVLACGRQDRRHRPGRDRPG